MLNPKIKESGKMKTKFVAIAYMTAFLSLLGSPFISVNANAAELVEMPSWEKVNKMLPMYSKFTVVDQETGLKFKVQRRAGSRHADVQPLSADDTRIMKKIYNGKWSWKRRAIIVVKGKKRIAASMHGMPHGAGALKNNFPGHFCIHFYGSTTHRTNRMDFSHKLMVLKAAGKLESHLAGPDPYEIVNAFIAGLKEQDETIVSLVSMQNEDWHALFAKIETVRIHSLTALPLEDVANELHLSIPITIEWYIKGAGPNKYQGNIELVRFSQTDPWKVDATAFFRKNQL
jgi:hypothetical protein